ncbi:MAG TPA: carboxypeptidase regulatory-like domain-containing protein [Candidatus Angelobacter sp.]|nr:carboxypeptidase regulatory-like domain-containing protein [Candidatus Angelobacter sp.]
MNFWPKGLRTCVLVLSILAIFAVTVPAFAQAQGRLHGQVTDPTGAVIPGASITVKNSSGLVVSAKSDGVGAYDVKGLAPGKYTVSATAKGFAPITQEVEIAAGQDKKSDIAMEILVKEETIEVQGEGAQVSTNSDNNANSVVLSGKDLDALSDDPDELQSELQALAGPSAGPNGGQIYIDGFTGGQLPPKSSIREIRINQNPFSAQYDRMGYGRIEILTKPGTDKLHGQFFFNDNHSFFDALNPFAAVEPDFSTQMISGNVGGPIGKKASYQFNAERRNINESTVVLPEAFTAANQPVVPLLNPRIRTSLSARLDYQLASSNTLMVRYQFTHNNEQNDGIGQLSLPSQGYNQTADENEIQVSDTQILSPHVINETRFEWQRTTTDQNPLATTPEINVLGQFVTGGNPIGINSILTTHYEVQNYTSINKGNHFWRLGGRLRSSANSSNSTQNFNGIFTFGATTDPSNPNGPAISSLTNFNNKTPTQFTLVTGNPLIENTFVDVGIYAEDDWKLRPNLTLSYGLRYETQNGIHDHNDWAPRLSLAWGLGKKNAPPKTVIRTGFGIFYDRFTQSLIMQAERLNGVNQQQITINNTGDNSAASLAAQATLQSLFATYPVLPPASSLVGATSSTNTYTINPNLRAPYTVQFAGSVERQLTKNATLTETFIHSHGVHQLFSEVASLLPLQYQFESGGVFNQNQLITNFNMRAGSKLTIFSFYMFSHANSNTAGATSFPSDPTLGVAADYGRAAFDVRHRLFFGGTFSLPYGFRVSPFMVANSGAPFNIITGQDLNGDTIINDRPAFATSTSTNVVQTSFGAFDVSPTPGETIIPMNFGTSPAQFALNMRVSKTIGIGPKMEAANNADQNNQRGNRGAGGRGPGGPVGSMGGGPRGGGPGGPFGAERSNQRYSLTFSVNARNIFNNVNPAPPIGNLSSGLFGQSTALAGGVFNTQSANRRIDLQVVFAF